MKELESDLEASESEKGRIVDALENFVNEVLPIPPDDLPTMDAILATPPTPTPDPLG